MKKSEHFPFLSMKDLKDLKDLNLGKDCLPETLKSARLSKGLSIRSLAKRAGCSHVHLLKIERGEKRPAARLLDSLQRELGMPSFLLTSTKGPSGLYSYTEGTPIHEDLICLPRGCGTVVALLLDALKKGGYDLAIQDPKLEEKDSGIAVIIEVLMGTSGRISIPIVVTE